MSEHKSYLDRVIVFEIYYHTLLAEDLCLDCKNYWESWSEDEQRQAMEAGKAEYERWVMEVDGSWTEPV